MLYVTRELSIEAFIKLPEFRTGDILRVNPFETVITFNPGSPKSRHNLSVCTTITSSKTYIN
jgi:hypothetical protein